MGSAGRTDPVPQAKPTKRALPILAILFLASLAVRLAVWMPVAHHAVPPLYDEIAYVERAIAYENILTSYLRGGLFWAQPSEADLKRAYYRGAWPPLHALLITLGFAVAGHSLAVARLVVVLQSAATTCVVFALTARLANRRAALFAAGLHIVYPSFIAYAHLLWSETTYILACLGALYCTVRVADDDRLSRQVRFALLGGVCLGLAGLARATVLPLLVAVPAWVSWRVRPAARRLLLPLAMLGLSVLVVWPWQATLLAREQRFVLLSAKSGHYLYERNNPYMGQEGALRQVRQRLAEYAQQNGVSRDEAGRALALAYIRAEPGVFLNRCLARARALWALDWYLLRHVFSATYPPLPHWAAVLIFLSVAASLPVLIGCTAYGLCVRRSQFRYRSLLVLCLLVSMLPNVVCVANSRMALPLFALLLPAAGVGLAELVKRRAWRRGLLLVVATAIGLWALNPTMPHDALGVRKQGSGHYRKALRMIARVFRADVETQDRIFVRYAAEKAPGHVRLTLLGDDYAFKESNSRSVVLPHAPPGAEQRITLRAPHVAADPLVLEVTLLSTGSHEIIHALRRDAWRQWRPTGLAGIEFFWAGAAGLSEEEMASLLRKDHEPPGQER